MKISAGRADRFAAHPDPAARAVLVYGPDRGLVTERAEALALSRVDDLSDPFLVTELTGAALAKDPARLADEVAAQSLIGGERVVRVREAGNDLAKLFGGFLDTPPDGALVVVEAGDLRPGALRTLFEKADNAAAIACYADDQNALEGVVRDALGAHGLRADRDAMAYLIANLGADRGVTRGELDKLALYMSGGGDTVTLDDAAACVGDSALIALDDAAYAVAGGDHAAAGRVLGRLARDGVAPITVLRAVSRHLQALHLVAGRAARGERLDQVIRGLRPPVHFKRVDSFRAQAQRWTAPNLATALGMTLAAERDCKTTGLPAQAVMSMALMRITEGARKTMARR